MRRVTIRIIKVRGMFRSYKDYRFSTVYCREWIRGKSALSSRFKNLVTMTLGTAPITSKRHPTNSGIENSHA